MKRSQLILESLRAELGLAPDLIGGEKAVLAQIERFLAHNEVPEHGDLRAYPEKWNHLVAEVIIPETSFFRHPESFSALTQWLRETGSRDFRCLCLPCSTGEEAWSIAMTFCEAGQPNVRIDALDASARSVAHAQAGRYVARSVRGLPETSRNRWFEAREDDIVVVPDLRRMVDFRVANAFSVDAAPQSYDVIFCRNLLIYFDGKNQRRLFERLAAWLRPHGVLFLGPGEATVAPSHGWKAAGWPMAFGFVRSDSRPRSAAEATPRPRRPKTLPPSAPAVRRTEDSTPGHQDVDEFTCAQELADAGRADEARTALERFHARHSPTAASLFLRGLLAESAGDAVGAESDYRRCLHLDPDNADALLHLALLLESTGRAPAARSFRRRLDRLASVP